MEAPSQSTALMEFQTNEHNVCEIDTFMPVVVELLEKYAGRSKEIYRKVDHDAGISTVLFVLCDNSFASVQLKSSGLLLLNIDIASEERVLFDYQVCKKFEQDMKEKLSASKSAALAPVRRGNAFSGERYLITSDERIIEYDVDKVIVDHQSQFQRIQILHTLNYGNILILDENQNLAESDFIYTETLMQRGKIDYKDKNILILGGGDGALLNELLKESPKFVTMVEIDEDVMKFCRQHLRSCCESALDSYTGPNHQIILNDCLVELDKFKANGGQFDFIFGDLTEIPLAGKPQDKEWQFFETILDKSLRVLKPGGCFLTHGAGTACVQSIELIESHFRGMQPEVMFNRTVEFIPSWMESWVFYQLTKRSEE